MEIKYIMLAILFLVAFAIGVIVGYVIGAEQNVKKLK